ncbi:MAG: 4Fe-4S binding protein [Firmicutes bacterium]|nr:4Fe-4S binding protein [Bacillota bacterium]
MATVTVTIDNRQIEVEQGITILEAAKKIGLKIPTLCHMREINEIGSCRICIVEVQGARTLQAACVTPVYDGMVVRTNTETVRQSRKMLLELILSTHPAECLTCLRNTNCELQTLAKSFGIDEIRFKRVTGKMVKEDSIDRSSPSLVRDPRKCVLCGRCVAVCEKVQGVKAIGSVNRGFDTVVAPPFDLELGDTNCVNCGQCALVCPTGAITEKDDTAEVWAALSDPTKHVVVQTAPAVRVAIAEEFGMEPGTLGTGKMVAALRILGFDKVFDTDFAADLTIMEEGNELLQRLESKQNLPLITSCSPGWIKYVEHFYPELISNLSTCKSPQQMLGALIKTYYAEKENIDPKDIVSVSIMPCTAKKFESARDEMNASGYQDVDYVLTTREFARMCKAAGIDWDNLPEEEFDTPLGISTGAGVIFGTTGGVMEAALRTAYELVTKEELDSLEFTAVRGLEGVKEAEIEMNSVKLKVAVVHSLKNAKIVMDKVKEGTADYAFIEVMACPGGCIGGGGQPIPTDLNVRMKRVAGIYQADEQLPIRKSHENPAIQALYEEYLGEPLSEKSHQLLHTEYVERDLFTNAPAKKEEKTAI